MKDTGKVRETVEFWRGMDREFYRYNKRALRQYVEFARNFAGDSGDIPAQGRTRGDGPDGEADNPILANLVTLATRQFRGDLYFRNPRAQVRTPGNYNRSVFTPLLANIETSLLEDFAEETRLYRHMRRSLLDGILGPYMVTKVQFDFDLAIDDDVVLEGRAAAQEEHRRYALLEIGPRVRDTDYHPSHIEEHEKFLAEMQRSQKYPKSAMAYMKKHIQKHRDMVPWTRVTETMRNQAVHARRVSPLLYRYDTFNVEAEQRTWVCEDFLMRVEDAKDRVGKDDWSKKAVEGIQPIKSHFAEAKENYPRMPMQYSVQSPDLMFRCSEYIDLVGSNGVAQIVLIAEGGAEPLQIRPYTGVKRHPSGPYIESQFLEHPLHNTGIPMHYTVKGHQEKASILAGINSETVERSLPCGWIDGRAAGTEDIGEILAARVAGMVVLKNLREGQKGEDVVGNIEPIAIPEQNMAMESYHRRQVENNFGGQAALGGGDHADTATASEVGARARNTLTDDSTAVLDDHMRWVFVHALRDMRKFYDANKVVEVFGPDALQEGGWPEEFADRDILMDRGISVVPGSSRRNDSAIEAKQYQEQLVVMTPLWEAGLVPPDYMIELIRRANEALGIFGMDYEGMTQHMVENAIQQAMGGQGAAGGPAQQQQGGGMGGKPSGAEPRLSENDEPSSASQTQGVNNVGGGRAGSSGGGFRAGMKQERRGREAVRA